MFGASSCDTVSFICINEVRSYVTWDARSESRTLYSVSFTQFTANRSNKTSGSSIFIAEVTASNSTYMASTFTIIGSTALIGIFVGCNSMERRLISPVTAITGKHALYYYDSIVSLGFYVLASYSTVLFNLQCNYFSRNT